MTATTTSSAGPPPVPPSSQPPTAPRRAVLLAAGVGVGAAAVVPSGPPGIGLVLLGLVGGALVLRVSGARLTGWRAVHAGAAALLLCSAAVRDADWVVALALLGATAAASLALAPARGWPAVLAGPFAVLRTLPAATGWLLHGVRTAAPGVRQATPALRGAALTAVLLAVFVPLLYTADAAFAAVLHAVVPDLTAIESLPVRVVVGLAAAVATGAALMLLVWPRPGPVVRPPSRLARRAEWLPPLLVLNGLLASFLAVQGSVLLGGADHVLRTAGVTYSSYLHEGFWQLVVVTGLVLLVVAAGARWAPRTARPLLGGLCCLALLVDVSAFSRLHLYVEAYGLTRLRLLVGATVLQLGAVLLLVLIAGLVARRSGLVDWLPHAVALSGCVVLLGLTAIDPDARIAHSGLERGDRADLAYLSTLSVDAVPVLDWLPEPARSCVLPRALPDAPWTSANLARARAADVLAQRPAGACVHLPG